MKKCPFCAEETQDEAIKCKHCGSDLSQPPKKKTDPRVARWAVIVIILSIFAWAMLREQPTPTANAVLAGPALSVVKFDWSVGKYGNRTLVGTVKNYSSKQYRYVQVEFNLYDKSGTQVGSTLANVNNLEAGGTWKFEAPILQENAYEAKVKSITGF